MYTEDGQKLKVLLGQSHCVKTQEEAEAIVQTDLKWQYFGYDGCMSLENFEENIVVYHNIILHDNPETFENETLVTNDDPMDVEVEVEDKEDAEEPLEDSGVADDSGLADDSKDNAKEAEKKPKKKVLKFDPLTSFRSLYLDDILKNLDKYFPNKMLADFDLFDQR